MLVSDGGDRLDPVARERIAELARKYRVAIYWIYIRSANSPGLTPTTAAESDVDTRAGVRPAPLLRIPRHPLPRL